MTTEPEPVLPAARLSAGPEDQDPLGAVAKPHAERTRDCDPQHHRPGPNRVIGLVATYWKYLKRGPTLGEASEAQPQQGAADTSLVLICTDEGSPLHALVTVAQERGHVETWRALARKWSIVLSCGIIRSEAPNHMAKAKKTSRKDDCFTLLVGEFVPFGIP